MQEEPEKEKGNLTLKEVLKKHLKASKRVNRRLTRGEGIKLYLVRMIDKFKEDVWKIKILKKK